MITETIAQTLTILQPKPARPVCIHCGHESTADDPVEYHWHHVGGQGDVRMLECTILPNCWERVDRKQERNIEIILDEAKAMERESRCRKYGHD